MGLTKWPCHGCGKPREVADVRWCAACTRNLHAVICSQPWGHQGGCDPHPLPAANDGTLVVHVS